ncbi:hypothetical protein [Pedobacter arcticus]|uniref:hypothetical protein n=1 Tax=Pedobacter arcticus TaxID=752140 RepID=UPI00031A2D19|nr:hypothetical protein [Pedobacter arcticus]
MKAIAIILLLAMSACNKASSPEGRSKIRDEKLEQEIRKLNDQNEAILDSINAINTEIHLLKKEK